MIKRVVCNLNKIYAFRCNFTTDPTTFVEKKTTNRLKNERRLHIR